MAFLTAIPVFAIAQKNPLVIDFIVDPAIQQRSGYNYENIYNLVDDIVTRASLIFNFEIGRTLTVGTVQIGTPIMRKLSQKS